MMFRSQNQNLVKVFLRQRSIQIVRNFRKLILFQVLRVQNLSERKLQKLTKRVRPKMKTKKIKERNREFYAPVSYKTMRTTSRVGLVKISLEPFPLKSYKFMSILSFIATKTILKIC